MRRSISQEEISLGRKREESHGEYSKRSSSNENQRKINSKVIKNTEIENKMTKIRILCKLPSDPIKL